MNKICNTCGLKKLLTEFSKNGKDSAGHIMRYPKCKECQSNDRVTKLDRLEVKKIDAQAKILDRLNLTPKERFKCAQAVKLLEYCLELEKKVRQ